MQSSNVVAPRNYKENIRRAIRMKRIASLAMYTILGMTLILIFTTITQLMVLKNISASSKAQLESVEKYWQERYNGLAKEKANLVLENEMLKESISETEDLKTVNREGKRTSTATIYINEDDLLFFQKVIQAEFGDGSFKVKQMGANVVVNRHLATGKSIRDVLEAPHQFSVVGNGAVNRVSIDEDTKLAVESILLGTRVFDEDVRFFWADYLSKSHMLWRKEIVTRVEGTVFAKD